MSLENGHRHYDNQPRKKKKKQPRRDCRAMADGPHKSDVDECGGVRGSHHKARHAWCSRRPCEPETLQALQQASHGQHEQSYSQSERPLPPHPRLVVCHGLQGVHGLGAGLPAHHLGGSSGAGGPQLKGNGRGRMGWGGGWEGSREGRVEGWGRGAGEAWLLQLIQWCGFAKKRLTANVWKAQQCSWPSHTAMNVCAAGTLASEEGC